MSLDGPDSARWPEVGLIDKCRMGGGGVHVTPSYWTDLMVLLVLYFTLSLILG